MVPAGIWFGIGAKVLLVLATRPVVPMYEKRERKTKRKRFLTIALIMAMTMGLSGCNNTDKATDVTEDKIVFVRVEYEDKIGGIFMHFADCLFIHL